MCVYVVRACLMCFLCFCEMLPITQVVKTRAEADEYCARLGQAEREVREVREQLESEVEVVRRELLGRLTELEPLPEALRRSEVLLEEAQDREHAQERRSTELSTVLADLRMKVWGLGGKFVFVWGGTCMCVVGGGVCVLYTM